MVVLVKYSKTSNAGKAISLVVNYVLKQNAEVKIEECILETDAKDGLAGGEVLFKDKENSVDKLESSVEILLHLGSLGKNLLGKDSSLTSECRELLEKLYRVGFELKNGPEMLELNELIKGKSFFLGRSLTVVDLVIYVSLYPHFAALSNEAPDFVPEYPNLSTFFEQIQLVTQVRQSCPESINYLDLAFFKKKLVKKEKKSSGGSANKQEERPLDDPTRIALRVGRILSVERHPTADKLYLEKIDLGEEEPRTILTGLVGVYDLTQKINELVIVVSNLKPRAMRGITSNGMLLCASTPPSSSDSFCEPVSVPKDAKVGELVFYNDFKGEPDTVLNTKTGKDPFAAVQPHYNVSDDLVCRFKESTMMTSAGPIFVENKALSHGKLS
ncbi:emap RNA binding domain-containing protein [Cryptosporidium canis]|uniref:Emap RNA binding domain-containing protein n=1 Tax=Cryptosporidium canis TaxID=195482 RepID=A0A9D5DJV0_9CRYT|nr:emap RNA binding domain-containing protein [Cryptosporidium canis]